MGKLNPQSLANKNKGMLKLKVVVKKLQKSLFQAKRSWSSSPKNTIFGTGKGTDDHHTVPQDVKEGHFAVIAADENEEQRFILPLAYLWCPSFQRLLERAAEEYGFNHEGALMLPCRGSELEWIMDAGRDWNPCVAMVESC